MRAGNGDTLFISDLHLSCDRPDKLELFRRFCAGPALAADAVYILGDLFEHFWLGNDDRSAPVAEVTGYLRACCEQGGQVFIARGNRELMLNAGFGELTGCQVLADETVLELAGCATLLMHGDLLCTRDRSYLALRRCLDLPLTRQIFLNLPYRLRRALARDLRALFKRTAEGKPAAIMDAEQESIEAIMRRHGVSALIHGHTHRPGQHHFELDGRAAQRYVLGDWYVEATVLVHRNGHAVFRRVEEYLSTYT